MTPAEIAAGQRFKSDGIRMFMDYHPDERGDPTVEKWCWSGEDDPDHGNGWLEIVVREIVTTEMSGTLVVYHRQWFNPEGEPIARRTRRVGSIGSLKALINRRKMILEKENSRAE